MCVNYMSKAFMWGLLSRLKPRIVGLLPQSTTTMFTIQYNNRVTIDIILDFKALLIFMS